jgi:2,3-bisphosphoglycerate-independent phosphoglycerate mutase
MTDYFGLIILDGWGLGDGSSSDAIAQANTPFMDEIRIKYPSSTLLTSGENVGLPEGQMGNSEVGHLNIGAGRIVYQELTRINKSIRDGDFYTNSVLLEAMKKAKKSKLHLIGLVSEGGVHSSQAHLHALCDLAKNQGVQNVFIHAFTDGRDCDPKSGLGYIQNLEAHLEKSVGKVATIVGRYYAMDRDNRWERVKKAYDLLVLSEGEQFSSASKAIESQYAKNRTDEFIDPIIIVEDGKPIARIADGDVVICFNFRTDRPREITQALTQQDFPEYQMNKLNLEYYTMTNYDKTYTNVEVIFEKDNLNQTIGEVLSKQGKSQVRIAETEKYPHVTFFFNGGRESEFLGEKRILVSSPKVATYDLLPEMSALEVKNRIVENMQKDKPNFICLNFANPDMVGHTGVFEAIVKAVETVDSCLKEVVDCGRKLGYEFLVIADHGNADFARNADGSPNTAHSLNPVPVILISDDEVKLNAGILADVAPTILRRMGIEKPTAMTGESLIEFL